MRAIMSKRDLEQAFELIDRNKLGDFHGPKPAALIVRAEQKLGVTFPHTYREFISRYGCGGIPPDEFYGLIQEDFENSGVPDAVWMTLEQRASNQFPTAFICVSETGDGGDYCIDTSQILADGESPIVEWWPGLPPDAKGNGRIVAEDFGAFLLSRVNEYMARKR
jgi:hypothetical protein